MHENADAKKKLRLNYQCLLANQGLITLLKYCIAKNMGKKKKEKKKKERVKIKTQKLQKAQKHLLAKVVEFYGAINH